MNGALRIATLLLAAMVSTTGCLGLFGDDEAEQADSTSVPRGVDERTQREIEQRTSAQFTNYTVLGQQALAPVTNWLNGSLSSGQGLTGVEDRNDRSGNNYGTEIIAEDISSDLPEGQPALVKAKLFYFGQAGASGDLDIYMNVPGTQTEFAADDCDEFSWKVCVQEMTVSTVGVSGHPAEVGVQAANGRTVQDMDYFLKVEIIYVEDVITPYLPYAVQVPENATGIVVSSDKAGTGSTIKAQLLVISPDDELVSFVDYNDISIPTESKLIPVSGPGEYIVYIIDIEGGFLGVEADVPVPKDQRQIRPLDRVEETTADATGPAPGMGKECPADLADDCQLAPPGGTTTFTAEGTFPLEVLGWINEEGSQNLNLNAEVRISSPNGMVFKQNKWVQYEDGDGTLGMTRDELNTNATFQNLAKGEYTVEYTIDGTATVGHTIVTYARG